MFLSCWDNITLFVCLTTSDNSNILCLSALPHGSFCAKLKYWIAIFSELYFSERIVVFFKIILFLSITKRLQVFCPTCMVSDIDCTSGNIGWGAVSDILTIYYHYNKQVKIFYYCYILVSFYPILISNRKNIDANWYINDFYIRIKVSCFLGQTIWSIWKCPRSQNHTFKILQNMIWYSSKLFSKFSLILGPPCVSIINASHDLCNTFQIIKICFSGFEGTFK